METRTVAPGEPESLRVDSAVGVTMDIARLVCQLEENTYATF